VDASGEFYITSKSDGVLRSLGTVFVTQPVNRLVTTGADASFTASVAADTAPSYRWQRQAEEGGEWEDLSNSPVFSGVSTTTLNLDSPDYSYNGSRFRCVATCTGAEAFSIAAALDLRSIPDSW
jgi:hypothetical protein